MTAKRRADFSKVDHGPESKIIHDVPSLKPTPTKLRTYRGKKRVSTDDTFGTHLKRGRYKKSILQHVGDENELCFCFTRI